MGLLEFFLLCIDFLAWPMLALAYPLWASIRAIETGSKYHMRKLVTYWTVYSIISLFEHTFKLMDWVPVWPYVKLIGTFWLVIPRFNGACYAYDHLIRANLGAKLHCIISQFSALRAHIQLNELNLHMQGIKPSLNNAKAGEQAQIPQNLFKDATSTPCIEDTSSAANCEKTGQLGNNPYKDFKIVERTSEQETEERKVKSPVGNIPKTAEEKIIPEINSSKLIQREWTCAVCQVTTTSEKDLKSHLGGMRHRTKCAELKSIKRVTKDTGSSPPRKARDLSKQVKNQSAKHALAGRKENTDPKLYCGLCNIWCPEEPAMVSHLKGRKHLSKLEQMCILMASEPTKHGPAGVKQEANVKPEKATGIPNEAKSELGGGSKQETNVKQEKAQAKASGQKEKHTEGNNASVSIDCRLYCGLCNIWCPGETGMASHLKGRKHLSKLKEMGILMR